MEGFIILVIFVLMVVILVLRAIVLIPRGEAATVERPGRYAQTLNSGPNFVIPIVDRVRGKADTRKRMVTFPPQAVITEDNLTVAIDTAVIFQISEPDRAIYSIDGYIFGIKQTTTATLRDVVGGLTLEETLTSRSYINRRLRGGLDEAATKQDLRIVRVGLKAIEPPPLVQQLMKKQMKADHKKRAMVLTAGDTREADIKTAGGRKQAQILAAEGNKHAVVLAAEAGHQATILCAEGARAAAYLETQGSARAAQKADAAVRASQLTPETLVWQYLEKLPELVNKDGNTVWMIPSQLGNSLESFTRAFDEKDTGGVFRYEPPTVSRETKEEAEQGRGKNQFDMSTNPELARAIATASGVANHPVDDPIAAAAGNTPERKKNRRANSAQPAQPRQLGGQNHPAAVEPVTPAAPAAPTAPPGPSDKRDLPSAPGTGNINAGDGTHSAERPNFSGWSRDPYAPENGQ